MDKRDKLQRVLVMAPPKYQALLEMNVIASKHAMLV